MLVTFLTFHNFIPRSAKFSCLHWGLLTASGMGFGSGFLYFTGCCSLQRGWVLAIALVIWFLRCAIYSRCFGRCPALICLTWLCWCLVFFHYFLYWGSSFLLFWGLCIGYKLAISVFFGCNALLLVLVGNDAGYVLMRECKHLWQQVVLIEIFEIVDLIERAQVFRCRVLDLC